MKKQIQYVKKLNTGGTCFFFVPRKNTFFVSFLLLSRSLHIIINAWFIHFLYSFFYKYEGGKNKLLFISGILQFIFRWLVFRCVCGWIVKLKFTRCMKVTKERDSYACHIKSRFTALSEAVCAHTLTPYTYTHIMASCTLWSITHFVTRDKAGNTFSHSMNP